MSIITDKTTLSIRVITMSYIAKQKIKGNIYLYQVESYWDKEKKQARQHRTYLGPENKQKVSKRTKRREIVYKKYGNIFLLERITEQLGLKKILAELFPDDYKEIIVLAFFHVCGESAMYMFPQWLHEQYNIEARSLYSSDISAICEKLGLLQTKIRDFFKSWIDLNKTKSTEIYYDVTSISSYATNIDFIEWGYNRDKENLPQLNLGIACQKEGLPLFYRIYPGSITDVTTLKNSLKLFDYFNLKDLTLSLDRGFCCKSNILELNSREDKMKFIQPITFSMKKAVKLLKSNRKKLQRINTSFKFNEEVLHYAKDTIDIEGNNFTAHLFYNEKIESDIRSNLLSELLEIVNKQKDKKLATMKAYLEFRKNNIPEKYILFFKLNRSAGNIELNDRNIREYLTKSGCFIILSNSDNLDKTNILEHYRTRDVVEKLFDTEKNDLDGGRLRAHSQYNCDGRIFIKFIALILHSKISTIMRERKLFDCYSVKELMAELSKIRCSVFDENFIVSEISKAQRNIFKAFQIEPEMLSTT